MTWIRVIIALLIAGCTIEIKPLPSDKSVKHHRHIKKPRPHRTPVPFCSPCPTSTPHINKPMELEHMTAPTPIITIPRTLSTIKLYQPPMV